MGPVVDLKPVDPLLIPSMSPNERVVELQRVVSLATAGASGLHRIIAGQHNENARYLLREGVEFLERVLADITLYHRGVEWWAQDIRASYHPHPILNAFASSLHRPAGSEIPRETAAAAQEMERAAKALLPIFSGLLDASSGPPNTNELRPSLEAYLRIADAYLDVTFQASEEYNRGPSATLSQAYARRGINRTSA